MLSNGVLMFSADQAVSEDRVDNQKASLKDQIWMWGTIVVAFALSLDPGRPGARARSLVPALAVVLLCSGCLSFSGQFGSRIPVERIASQYASAVFFKLCATRLGAVNDIDIPTTEAKFLDE